MELSRDLPHDLGNPCKRFLLTATLLSFWAHPESAQISIITIPNQPMEGGDVSLTALHTPDGILNATWYSGPQPLYPDMITSCILTTQAGPCAQRLGPAHTTRETLVSWNTLQIRNLTSSDTGFYSLMLNTDSGLVNASTYMRVGHQKAYLSQPVISANMTVALENVDSVVFTCKTNETNVEILWYKGGLILRVGGRLQLSNGNRTLTIRQVTRDDMGQYFCRVWKQSEYRTSSFIQLTVVYGPGRVVTSSYPKPYEGIVVSDLNYSVVLQCYATANPKPLISWSLNGSVCGTHDKHIIQRLTQKDLGNYTCTVQNSVGLTISDPIQVRLPNPPSEDTDTKPIEPGPKYALSGVPAVLLTIAGIVGIGSSVGLITCSVIKSNVLKKGRMSQGGAAWELQRPFSPGGLGQVSSGKQEGNVMTTLRPL